MHPEVAKALMDEAHNYSHKASFSIELAVPAEDIHRQPEVRDAIHGYFKKQKDDAIWELKEVFRDGWTALFFGGMGLIALLIISEALFSTINSPAINYLGKTLVIVGWVVLWIPLESLLYRHIPIRRRKRYAEAMEKSEVRLVQAP